MPDASDLPVGRLQSIQRDWDYQSGWVRAPLREIVFNDRLSKQARLVWLWLASVPQNSSHISWGECETMLRCGTKARRSCIAQLVIEGFISVGDNGVVIMHDPYVVYNEKRAEILNEMREEWKEESVTVQDFEDISSTFNFISTEKNIDDQINKLKETKPTKQTQPKSKSLPPELKIIIESWNNCKPETYSSMRTVSTKQRECISRHMKNLGLTNDNIEDFICSVCNGLKKSDFWSQKVDQSGRNFNAVFGYGSPQDTKMKNIENLYNAGNEEIPEIKQKLPLKYNIEQQETIDAYRFIRLNLDQARQRSDRSEIERWSKLMETTLQDISDYQIDIDDIK